MSFFQISTSSIDQILATMTGLFDSVSPLLLIIIALSVGFWIVSEILSVTKKEKELGDWWETDPLLNESDKKYYRKTRGRKTEDEDF